MIDFMQKYFIFHHSFSLDFCWLFVCSLQFIMVNVFKVISRYVSKSEILIKSFVPSHFISQKNWGWRTKINLFYSVIEATEMILILTGKPGGHGKASPDNINSDRVVAIDNPGRFLQHGRHLLEAVQAGRLPGHQLHQRLCNTAGSLLTKPI